MTEFMSQHQQTAEQIEQLLLLWGAASAAVTDNSHLHVGHAGAQSGGGHFAVRVVADAFAGLNRIQSHRLVYQQLTDLFQNGRIHALEVEALTPNAVSP
ncbi:BolA family protein [Marinicella meishanensis]|uniref:BolA family protein n=1 Tax=Marinicella meishanensis TaxID=2873263 RepID=UPI001CBF3FA1|nr:BolA family protein [Marinicella sp. NBU2979]